MALTSITAEFDTFDSADFVARKIGQQVKGVTKTRIQSPTGKTHNTAFTNTVGFSNSIGIAPQAMSGGYQFTGLIPQSDYIDGTIEPLKNEKAQLTITCSENTVHNVEQMLINCGGANVRRINS